MKKTLRFNEFKTKINENNGSYFDIENIFKDYLIAALWSSLDSFEDDDIEDDDFDENHMIRSRKNIRPNGEKRGENLDAAYSIDDIDENLRIHLYNQVKKFVLENEKNLIDSELNENEIGHTLWLAQNEHGSSFADYSNRVDFDILDVLDTAARKMNKVDLYVGDDDVIYAMGKENESLIKEEIFNFISPDYKSGLAPNDEQKLKDFLTKQNLEVASIKEDEKIEIPLEIETVELVEKVKYIVERFNDFKK